MNAHALDIRYRPAESSDLDSIVQMIGTLIEELDSDGHSNEIQTRLPKDINLALSSDHVRIFLAHHNEQLVGLSRADVLTNNPIFRLRQESRCGYIDQMYVLPTFRRNGIGKELLKCCEDWFKDLELEHVLLHAAPRAVNFYACHGYQANREMFKKLT